MNTKPTAHIPPPNYGPAQPYWIVAEHNKIRDEMNAFYHQQWEEMNNKKYQPYQPTADEVMALQKQMLEENEKMKMDKPNTKNVMVAAGAWEEPTMEKMRAGQAAKMLKEAFQSWSIPQRKEPSVLNQTLTRQDAWNIVWDAVAQMSTDTILYPWLSKRVFQVCHNRMNPMLDALAVDSVLNPKPTTIISQDPPPEPINPFERTFS